MPAGADGDRAPDGGLLDASAAPGTWVSDELQRALGRIDSLGREMQQLVTVIRLQQDEVARLTDSMQVVEGRTMRHDTTQEQTREVRHEIAEVAERLAQEVSLRRDLAAQMDRSRQRESETQQELQRVLQLIATRLDEFDGRVSAEMHRQTAIREDVTRDVQTDEDASVRIERLEHRVGAEFESARHQGTEIARLASSVSQLMSAVDSIEARLRAMQQDQRRLDDDVATLRSIRERESELIEVMEQHRATRARLEDRVSGVEESLESLRQALAAAAEERALLTRQVAGEAEQRRGLAERLEAQRDTFTEHFRRAARADEESRRRMIEEMERDIRVARSLLVKMAEQSDESEQEQPL